MFSLSELAKRGHHLQLLDSEIIQDTQYFVLKVTLSDGFETYRYINTQSWLVELSRDFRAFHPGIDDTKQHLETRYDQWRQDDGVVYASRSQNIDLETKEIIATTLVLESKYNVTHEQLDLHRGFVPDGTPDVVQ